MFFKNNIRLLNRYRQIISIIIKYGFEQVLDEAGIARRYTWLKRKFPSSFGFDVKNYNLWERLRMAVEELGTTYIKFAQILANRPDLVPKQLMDELVKLQDHVSPFDGKDAVEIVERELGRKLTDIFDDFDLIPFAAASIGQVHKARLKDGTDVVVKVQRPRIKEKVLLDLKIMRYLAKMVAENSPSLALFDPVGNVKMFEESIKKELDFSHEAMNLQRFANDFENTDFIIVPKFYATYSTKQVLVMEYINGVKPTDKEGMMKLGCDPEIVARNGINAFFRQVFDFGFFHADPHPGNIFVLPGNRICFIDFGMMGRVLKRDLEFFSDVLIGTVTKNSARVIWGMKNLAVSQDFDDNRAFEYKVDELVNEYGQLTPDKLNMNELFNEMKDLVVEYKIRMSGDFFLLSKALVTIEGVGRSICPTLNIMDEVKPHLIRAVKQQYGVKTILKKLIGAAKDSIGLIDTLPQDLREIIKKYKKGEIRVAIEHKGAEEIGRRLDGMVNRLIMAMLAGMLILSASILVAVNFPPLENGVSLFGIIGYVAAGALCLRILYAVWRGRKFR